MTAPRLFNDLGVLNALMKEEKTFKVPARCERAVEFLCGFGDALGRGLGRTTETGRGGKINVRAGVWPVSEQEEFSSNFNKFGNVVDALEEEGKEGRLNESMLFFITDSSTVEGAVDRGNTPSRALFEKIVRIKRIQFRLKSVLYVINYSGARII